MFFPLRLPGTEFWPAIRKQDEKKRRIDEVKKHIKEVDDKLAALAKEEGPKDAEGQPPLDSTEKKN